MAIIGLAGAVPGGIWAERRSLRGKAMKIRLRERDSRLCWLVGTLSAATGS